MAGVLTSTTLYALVTRASYITHCELEELAFCELEELAFMLACACDVCVTFENQSKTHPGQVSENARKRPYFTMADLILLKKGQFSISCPDCADLCSVIAIISVDVLGFT